MKRSSSSSSRACVSRICVAVSLPPGAASAHQRLVARQLSLQLIVLLLHEAQIETVFLELVGFAAQAREVIAGRAGHHASVFTLKVCQA